MLNPCQIELPSPTRTMYEIRQGAATVQLNVASLKMLPPTPHPLAARTPPTTYMAGASGHPWTSGLGTQPSGTESGQSPGTVSPPEKSSKKRAQLGGLVGDGVGVGAQTRWLLSPQLLPTLMSWVHHEPHGPLPDAAAAAVL